jgi:hypothetical protein
MSWIQAVKCIVSGVYMCKRSVIVIIIHVIYNL